MILIRLFFQMYKYLIECYTIVILNVTFFLSYFESLISKNLLDSIQGTPRAYL